MQISHQSALKKRSGRSHHFWSKFFLALGTLVALVLIAFFGATTVICLGPSPTMRDLFVNTVMETSAAKFLARIYFDEPTIEAIIAANRPRTNGDVSDTDAVVLPAEDADFDLSAITVHDVKGSTFVGKMMVVNDPSRLSVATLEQFDVQAQGGELLDMIQTNGAVAGINGGGFYDPNGTGQGGMPDGVVIKEGQVLCNTPTRYDTIIGFTTDHKLLVGDLTAQQALDAGVQEAVSFGPALVMNGNRLPITGNGGGLNPRSAIGQREDGAVLLLVIDGRQPHSLGASYRDVADVMLEFGAVNAANLDGGSSSMLYYEGEMLNTLSSLIGVRKIPTAFIVK